MVGDNPLGAYFVFPSAVILFENLIISLRMKPGYTFRVR